MMLLSRQRYEATLGTYMLDRLAVRQAGLSDRLAVRQSGCQMLL